MPVSMFHHRSDIPSQIPWVPASGSHHKYRHNLHLRMFENLRSRMHLTAFADHLCTYLITVQKKYLHNLLHKFSDCHSHFQSDGHFSVFVSPFIFTFLTLLIHWFTFPGVTERITYRFREILAVTVKCVRHFVRLYNLSLFFRFFILIS